MKDFYKNVVTLGGLGESVSKGQGTLGTLATIPIIWILGIFHPYVYLIVVSALVIFSIYSCQVYENFKGSHDSSEIIIDEVVGFLVAMAWLPFNVWFILSGFVFFRILDIFKPGPIGWIDKKVKGGAGVVLDDVAAGLIVNLVLQFVYQNPGVISF